MLVLTRETTEQPQSPVGPNWSNPLSKGLLALFCGPSGFELVNRLQFLQDGSPTQAVTAAGRTIQTVTNAASYDGFYAPENASGSRSTKLYDPSSPPVVVWCVGNGKSGVNLGAGFARGRGSSAGLPFGVGFWDGGFKGAWLAVNTTGGTIGVSIPTTTINTTQGQHVAVAVIGATTTTCYIDGIACYSAATPSGSFSYEYADIYRCLSIGGGYVFAGGNIAAAGLHAGVEWTPTQVMQFSANPWQVFE